MRKFAKFTLFFLHLIFLLNSTIFPAIVSGTLVTTPKGYVPIEKLRVGDVVVGYCYKCKSLIETPIKKIKKKMIEEVFVIRTNKEELQVSKDHLFYNPAQKKFVQAKSIRCNDALASFVLSENESSLTPIKCDCPNIIIKNAMAYDIELEEPKLFFISESLILVHNAVGVAIGLGISWGLGAVAFEGVKFSLALGGVALLGYTLGNAYNKYHFKCDPAALLENLYRKSKSGKKAKPEEKKAKKSEEKKKGEKQEKAPGKPTKNDKFEEPKGKVGNGGRKVKHPKTGQWGWKDIKGYIWVPTGLGPLAHGGPHWDVIDKFGNRIANIVPGGKCI